jgi:hypothetical protein
MKYQEAILPAEVESGEMRLTLLGTSATLHTRGLIALILAALFLLIVNPSAKADYYPLSCANYPQMPPRYTPPQYGGVSTAVLVPRGATVWVFYHRLRAEASWIDVCSSADNGTTWFSHTRGGTEGGGPFFILTLGPHPHQSWHLTAISNRIYGSVHGGNYNWSGVARYDHAWGVTFAWYDSAGPAEPNTLIHICLTRNNCPGF